MTKDEIILKIKSLYNPLNIKGMARFGINSENTFGVSMPVLRTIARENRKNHTLALELWETGIHEAKILAALIDNPKEVTEEQMEHWVLGFDSWDVCDQCCMNLFDKTQFSYEKAFQWSKRKEEFVKRAGFVIMASLAIHDKKAEDKKLEEFLTVIEREAYDERNFVKKAVNWALRQIGKRNFFLNNSALLTAERILKQDSKSARWIAKDAIKELSGDKISDLLKRRLKV
ncbi:MAG: DNA alkylation repair protein [Bacteroidota bacterium]|nr:DNA alkylation repair protein [Bacteroidota bacterium]MDP4192540.1 DNA alkylation repair protein [Bacteroidota bacterium]MDP4194447.1 DNA alkylation repair protein [Bacteroidota bacterium]